MSKKIISVILTHQSPEHVKRMCSYWSREIQDVSLFIAYGGTMDNFKAIECPDKVYIDDLRLRTRDHQRDRQSYARVFEDVSVALKEKEFDYIFFTEFDQIPLRRNLFELLIERIVHERADVLMHGLKRVNGTGHAHYLYHKGLGKFEDLISSCSIRTKHDVVLSAVGFGQFWKREAFDSVASINDTIGCYLELWIPTIAHHLGFRLRNLKDQNPYNGVGKDLSAMLTEYRDRGAWLIHPVKYAWESDQTII